MTLQAFIDTYLCNGCGSCAEVAPDHFRMNSDLEKAEFHLTGSRCSQTAVEQAMAMCPVKCIVLEQDS